MSTAAPELDTRRRLPLPPIRLRRPRADLSFLVLVLIVALAAPLIVTGLGLDGPLVRDPHAVKLFGNPTGPGGSHPLGVDGSGRDVLSRILYGLRSLVLISLAGAALATAASGLLAGLARLSPRLGGLRDLVIGALGAYPVMLLGLVLGLSLSGVWRLLVPIALVQLLSLTSPRQLPAAFAFTLSRAVGIDFGLTFLGVGPGGSTPQLGAMVARAGLGIVAGVPAWWALVFPGLAVMLVLIAAQSLGRALAPILELAPILAAAPARASSAAAPPARASPTVAFPRRSPLAAQLLGCVVRLIVAAGLAAALFSTLGGTDPDGQPALAGIGPELGASGSLLLGAVVVWAVAVWLHLRLVTRVRTRRVSPGPTRGWIGSLGTSASLGPAALLSAAPVGWLAFLSLDGFSESVGTLPVLPGFGSYVTVTHDAGRWAQSLVIPWLLLGLLAAAWTILSLRRPATQVARSAQQRVARAAGVPERTLARQRRRALRGSLIAQARAILPSVAGAVLIVEASFKIPGVGREILTAFELRQPATASDLTWLVTVGVIVLSAVLGVAQTVIDPRAVRR